MVDGIAAMGAGMQQAQLQTEVSANVASMGLDAVEDQGDAMVDMMNEVFENLGSYIDTLA